MKIGGTAEWPEHYEDSQLEKTIPYQDPHIDVDDGPPDTGCEASSDVDYGPYMEPGMADFIRKMSRDDLIETALRLYADAGRLRRELDDARGVIR